jgi:hypothetical protein
LSDEDYLALGRVFELDQQYMIEQVRVDSWTSQKLGEPLRVVFSERAGDVPSRLAGLHRRYSFSSYLL